MTKFMIKKKITGAEKIHITNMIKEVGIPKPHSNNNYKIFFVGIC